MSIPSTAIYKNKNTREYVPKTLKLKGSKFFFSVWFLASLRRFLDFIINVSKSFLFSQDIVPTCDNLLQHCQPSH